jgi:hypothetical protein
MEVRLDELRQRCSAPSDGFSAGVWCEAANEGVQIALALLAALAVAREREQRLREVLAPVLALTDECGVLWGDAEWELIVAARAALADEPAAALAGGGDEGGTATAREPTSGVAPAASAAADEPGETP